MVGCPYAANIDAAEYQWDLNPGSLGASFVSLTTEPWLLKDDDDWVKNNVSLEVEGARQRDRPRPGCDQRVNDLHIKPSRAIDRSK